MLILSPVTDNCPSISARVRMISNLNERMWPDRVSNQRPIDSQSDSLPTALGGPANLKSMSIKYEHLISYFGLFRLYGRRQCLALILDHVWSTINKHETLVTQHNLTHLQVLNNKSSLLGLKYGCLFVQLGNKTNTIDRSINIHVIRSILSLAKEIFIFTSYSCLYLSGFGKRVIYEIMWCFSPW